MMRAKSVKSRARLFFKPTTIVFAVVLAFALAGGSRAGTQVVEDFQNITELPPRGWFLQNNSVPVGSTGWLQGNVNVFSAQAGAVTSYIAANFNNVSGANTISNWLVAPNLTLTNGDVVRFWTRTVAAPDFPDRLEVRLSTNGASTNVGTGAEAVGDFTRLLLSINPNLQMGGYPQVRTEYTIILSELPPEGVSGRVAFRYYVTDGGPMGDNSNYIGIDTFSVVNGAPLAPEAPLDFDGDGQTDYVVVRNTGGGAGEQMTWFVNNGAAHTQTAWGIPGDLLVAGDFDGDDKADITVYRPSVNSVFYTLRSATGTFASCNLGGANDNPTIIGDYNGDDVDDYAVYRQGALGQSSLWSYRSGASPNGFIVTVQWGTPGDTPAPGDYDGDNFNDFCVRTSYGNGQGAFRLLKAAGGSETVLWGTVSDLIAPGDYDGDGKDDFAVVRADGAQLLWSVLGRNSGNIIHYGAPWGLSATDFPTPGDYDGDGKIDLAVWRPSADPEQNFFYIRKSSDGALQAFEWGQQGDFTVAAFNTH